MAKQLQTASIQAPGFYGLNLQESSVTLPEGFALKAENCIIDSFGRLGSRKGWEYVTDTALFPNIELQGAHVFKEIDGTQNIITWCETNFYVVGGVYNETLSIVDHATNTSNPSPLGTNNFTCATLNDVMYVFDRDFHPMYLDAGTTDLYDHPDAPQGNVVLSAYGRLWVADTASDKMTVWWSDLLDGKNFTTGSAGSVDLAAVLVKGGDRVVSLGAHAGRLIILCENSVVIYGDSEADTVFDPITMRLVEVIQGTGCAVRDSVQNIGNDLMFLAHDGVRSLGRLVQEKGQPMSDVSKNIRDELVREVNTSNTSKIRSVFSPLDAFYLLLLPDYNEVYCFDVREYLQDGSARVTSWEDATYTNMFVYGDVLHFTQPAGIAKYAGYQDNGSSYVMKYYTNHMNFGDPTVLKHPKRISVTAISSKAQEVQFLIGYDYSENYGPYSAIMTNTSISEFGVAEFGVDEYASGENTETIRSSIGGSGNVLQAAIEATIDGYPLSVQRLDLYVKQGRIY